MSSMLFVIYMYPVKLGRAEVKKPKKIGLESHNNNRSVSCAKPTDYTEFSR